MANPPQFYCRCCGRRGVASRTALEAYEVRVCLARPGTPLPVDIDCEATDAFGVLGGVFCFGCQIAGYVNVYLTPMLGEIVSSAWHAPEAFERRSISSARSPCSV